MLEIRDASPDELSSLSAIAWAAKAHWGYPDAWLERWRPELTYDAVALEQQDVFVVTGASLLGVAGISVDGADAEVEGLWVDPSAMGRGAGRALFEECVRRARAAGAARLIIDSDPNAVGFYERMGAKRIGAVPTAIEGRELPRLVMPLTTTGGDGSRSKSADVTSG